MQRCGLRVCHWQFRWSGIPKRDAAPAVGRSVAGKLAGSATRAKQMSKWYSLMVFLLSETNGIRQNKGPTSRALNPYQLYVIIGEWRRWARHSFGYEIRSLIQSPAASSFFFICTRKDEEREWRYFKHTTEKSTIYNLIIF